MLTGSSISGPAVAATIPRAASSTNRKSREAFPVPHTSMPSRPADTSNENNNSVVLALTLGQVTFILTGDAEAENWATIAARLPASMRVFQVPHHGGRNGTFGPGDVTPWLDLIPGATQLALSSHIRPHGHPHADVVNLLGARNFVSFRTDVQSHLTFSTDGTNVDVQYSHV